MLRQQIINRLIQFQAIQSVPNWISNCNVRLREREKKKLYHENQGRERAYHSVEFGNCVFYSHGKSLTLNHRFISVILALTPATRRTGDRSHYEQLPVRL